MIKFFKKYCMNFIIFSIKAILMSLYAKYNYISDQCSDIYLTRNILSRKSNIFDSPSPVTHLENFLIKVERSTI